MRAVTDPLALVGDDEVDAVLIASPGFVHEEQVLACLEAGKAVLCEKPLTMDGASSLRLVRAEREGGRALVQLGFMRRFDPEYARLKALLDSGRLGRLLLLHNIHRNKDVPDSFRSEMIVRDSLVHEVDVSRFLFGEEIAEVTVYSPTPTSAAAEGVIDPQVSVFRMASGAVVTNEVFVRNQVGYEVRCEAVVRARAAPSPGARGATSTRPRRGQRGRRGVGRHGADRLPRPLRAAPTTSSCRPGSTRPGAARSWARRPGTATPPRSSARPGWPRSPPERPVAVDIVDQETLT